MNSRLNRLMSTMWSIASWMLIIFLFGLTAISSLFTTYVCYDMSHYDISVFNTIPWVFLTSILLLAAIGVLSRVVSLDVCGFAKMTAAFAFFVSLAWMFIACSEPAWDSVNMLRAAAALGGSGNEADLLQWAQGGYIDRFSYQVPLAYVFLGFIRLAGDRAFLFIEVVNCLSNSVTAYLIVKCTALMFDDNRAVAASSVLCMSFFGLYLYSTFVYGNLLSLTFFFLAVYGFLRVECVVRGGSWLKSRDFLWALVSCVSLAVSVILKSTMQIGLIALGISFLCLAVRSKSPALLIGCVLPLVLVRCITSFAISSSEASMGVNLSDEQLPKSSWIAMGIGASKELYADNAGNASIATDNTLPGWFDAYIWEEPDCYGYLSYGEMNRALISRRIQRFIDDPAYAVRFFAKKFVIEWTEPSYECFLASNWAGESPVLPEGNRAGRENYTALARSFYYGDAHAALLAFMDGNQFLIAFGALYAFFRRKLRGRITPELGGLALFTLGGALLYLVWEMKSQYIFPFYLALIPYASLGLSCFVAETWNWFLKHTGSIVRRAACEVNEKL